MSKSPRNIASMCTFQLLKLMMIVFFCEDVLNKNKFNHQHLQKPWEWKNKTSQLIFSLEYTFHFHVHVVFWFPCCPFVLNTSTIPSSAGFSLPPGWWWQRFGGFQVGTTEDHQRAAKVETGGAISPWFPYHRWDSYLIPQKSTIHGGRYTSPMDGLGQEIFKHDLFLGKCLTSYDWAKKCFFLMSEINQQKHHPEYVWL